MSEPLNYLRSASDDLFNDWIPQMKAQYPQEAAMCEAVLEMAKTAPKFILPDGGRIFDDKLRGLPDELRLPFPTIAIEYRAIRGAVGVVEQEFGDSVFQAPKRIVVARQESDGYIAVHSLVEFSAHGVTRWAMLPYVAAVMRGDASKPPTITNQNFVDGLSIAVTPTGERCEAELGDDWKRHAYCDLIDECHAVLALIEALSCINVTHEPLPTRKLNKTAARNGALPFDEYRVLVIKGNSGSDKSIGSSIYRSPREHLRRGHIRRLHDGRRVWVNATIVSAGAAGRVTTTYDTRRAA